MASSANGSSGDPARWLVTGAAGFIGSNLVESLLRDGHEVVGLDNFSTGHRHNLDQVAVAVGQDAWRRFRMIEGDIRRDADCRDAVQGVRYVLHQAALGSVPRSIAQPLASFESNVDGFVRMLNAAREAGVQRFVYASSSSVYGDSPELPKHEDRVGRPLSPYAATKSSNELFADVWARTYGMSVVGLRYFNVFGPRQDPAGPYAAVIPRWVAALMSGEPCWVNGDGHSSRDFCYVANAVQANLRSALSGGELPPHVVLNVACGEQTSLLQLFDLLKQALSAADPALAERLSGVVPAFRPFRDGDVRHSLASIERAERLIGYQPSHRIADGIAAAVRWYLRDHQARKPA